MRTAIFRFSAIVSIFMRLLFPAQEDQSEPKTNPQEISSPPGYVIIACDSIGIDIFIDNVLVGQTPLSYPIPLPEGKHKITYLDPSFLHLISQYHTAKEFERFTSDGLKTVMIYPDQTVKVKLWYQSYRNMIKITRLEAFTKYGIGAIVIAVLLLLVTQPIL